VCVYAVLVWEPPAASAIVIIVCISWLIKVTDSWLIKVTDSNDARWKPETVSKLFPLKYHTVNPILSTL